MANQWPPLFRYFHHKARKRKKQWIILFREKFTKLIFRMVLGLVSFLVLFSLKYDGGNCLENAAGTGKYFL